MDKIRKAFGWWFGSWWHPLVVYFITMVLLCVTMAVDYCIGLPGIGVKKLISTLGEVAGVGLLAFLLLQFVVVFIAGIVLMFKKRAGTGIAFCLEMVVCFGVTWFMLIFFTIAMMFNDKDTFADDLKLPENIELSEPLESSAHSFDARLDEDAFFNALLASLENGEKMAEDEELRMPVLEKMMSTEDGQAKLRAYFQACPNWKFTRNKIDGTMATRTAYVGNGIYSMEDSHWAWLEPLPGSHDSRHMQYSFRIYLDGYPDRLFAKKFDKKGTIEVNNGVSTLSTWIESGEAKVYILAQGPGNVRAMTRKMVEMVETELAEMDLAAQGRPGRDTDVTLYNGMQGGIYVMDIWCNPGEPGELSISANEITNGTELSKHRLPEHNVWTYGSSEDKSYFSQIRFTIYEGNWEQYYGAHLKLWFRPESGGEKRLLWEGDYRIQGWMR